MAEKNDFKKIYENLSDQANGKIRGEAIIGRLEYIRHQRGGEGIRIMAGGLKEAGCPMEPEKLQSLAWYPEAYGVIIILIAQKVFGWGDADIFAMGQNAPKISFLVKMLMKYFVSLEKTFQASPENWKKHHSAGILEAAEFSVKNRRLTLRLKDYKLHPAVCVFLKGYFLQFAKMVIQSENVEVRETKCMFDGADCHEYSVTWK